MENIEEQKERAVIILKGILSWHERVAAAQAMNPGKEKEISDVYADALKTAITVLES